MLEVWSEERDYGDHNGVNCSLLTHKLSSTLESYSKQKRIPFQLSLDLNK